MRLPAWRGWFPPRPVLLKDLLAGLPRAIGSVPDGMASGLLAGVSPVNGLYASVAGPLFGGLTSSTRLMVVTTTSAGALAAASALQGVRPDNRAGAVALLSLLAGLVMIGAGMLRLGRYTRFVSHSVMIGFLTGISANIIFGQIPDLTGAPAHGSNNLAKATSVLTDPAAINLPSLLTGVAAGAIIVLLGRTALSAYSALLALVIPTLAVIVLHADSVARVRDDGEIPAGFPLPALPDFSEFSFGLLGSAFAVAAIVLVQGAGVAESAPNPGGPPSSASQDFTSQGIANVAASLVRGQPVGGSVGQTALNISSGAHTRWAAIFSGLWLLLILLAFSGVIGVVAQPTLAALLIVAAVASIRPHQIMMIMRTGAVSQVALVATFLATLFLPVAAAVGVGVALSLVMQLNREALDLKVVRLVPTGTTWRETKPPKSLSAHEVVALDVYGSLLYAGPRTLQTVLPEPSHARGSAVVIRLRGRTQLGATFFLVVDEYAHALDATDSRLFISGVDPVLRAQHRRNHRAHERDLVEVFEATELIGASTNAALEAAELWVELAPGLEGPDDQSAQRHHHRGSDDTAPDDARKESTAPAAPREKQLPGDPQDLEGPEPDDGVAEDPDDMADLDPDNGLPEDPEADRRP